MATVVKVHLAVGDGACVYEGEIKGIDADSVDQTTLRTIFRSFNETARDDAELTDDQAASMRFVLEEDEEEGNFFNPDASSVVAGRVKEIADGLEKTLREDQVINETDESVLRYCTTQTEGTDETDFGTRVLQLDRVKDHLMAVFGHLLSRDELMNSSALKVVIRFASGIAYCYNFCKKLLLGALHNFMPATVVDLMCNIASLFMQHLIRIGFDRITQGLGGWAQLVGSLALSRGLSVVSERLGASKYFFAVAAVASAGIAVYLHFSGK